MTSFTCVMAWLCIAVLLPQMLFIWALENKEQELTGIEIMDGAGERFLAKATACSSFASSLDVLSLFQVSQDRIIRFNSSCFAIELGIRKHYGPYFGHEFFLFFNYALLVLPEYLFRGRFDAQISCRVYS